MSRILRRPMFRGGPVDSRGTGITSGLGYENGGRVGMIMVVKYYKQLEKNQQELEIQEILVLQM